MKRLGEIEMKTDGINGIDIEVNTAVSNRLLYLLFSIIVLILAFPLLVPALFVEGLFWIITGSFKFEVSIREKFKMVFKFIHRFAIRILA